MSDTYAPCPNKCGGEVPLFVDETSGPDPSVGLPNGSYVVGIDDEENATTHEPGCPPLTDEQRRYLEDEFDVSDYLQAKYEQWAEIGL